MGRKSNPALGQNFFTDTEKLRELASILPKDKTVLEIGAGLGALTRILSEFSQKVYAVEKDAVLCAWLAENMKDDKLEVICGDFLELDLPPLPHDFIAAGNLPYYITTPVCERLFLLSPTQMLLMVQKEAGERFFARPGQKNYGAVAVLSRLYYTANCLCELSEACYYPQPAVRSVVVHFEKKATAPAVPPQSLARFVKSCLALRRKTLANNLKGTVGLDAALLQTGISPATRGEALTPEQFLLLYEVLRTYDRD